MTSRTCEEQPHILLSSYCFEIGRGCRTSSCLDGTNTPSSKAAHVQHLLRVKLQLHVIAGIVAPSPTMTTKDKSLSCREANGLLRVRQCVITLVQDMYANLSMSCQARFFRVLSGIVHITVASDCYLKIAEAEAEPLAGFNR